MFLIAALGISAWVWVEADGSVVVGDDIDASCSSVNTGTITGANVGVDCDDERPAD